MNIRQGLERSWLFLTKRSGAYRAIFAGPVAHTVLEDLAQFCRANESTYHPDPRVHAALEGRREVWLRIAAHLNLPDEELWKLYNPGIRLKGDYDQ